MGTSAEAWGKLAAAMGKIWGSLEKFVGGDPEASESCRWQDDRVGENCAQPKRSLEWADFDEEEMNQQSKRFFVLSQVWSETTSTDEAFVWGLVYTLWSPPRVPVISWTTAPPVAQRALCSKRCARSKNASTVNS